MRWLIREKRASVAGGEGAGFVTKWPINGWYGQSVVNKPYVAVDDRGRVFVTDPENYRVLVFDDEGEFLQTFGQFGIDVSSFNLPIGVAVDQDARLRRQVHVAEALDPGVHPHP